MLSVDSVFEKDRIYHAYLVEFFNNSIVVDCLLLYFASRLAVYLSY